MKRRHTHIAQGQGGVCACVGGASLTPLPTSPSQTRNARRGRPQGNKGEKRTHLLTRGQGVVQTHVACQGHTTAQSPMAKLAKRAVGVGAEAGMGVEAGMEEEEEEEGMDEGGAPHQ